MSDTNLPIRSPAAKRCCRIGNGFGMMAFAGMVGRSLARAGVNRQPGRGGDARLSAARQARDLPVHERRLLARRQLRSEADARQVRRPAAARRHHQDRAPDRRADEIAVQVQEVRPVRHGRQRAVAAPGRSGRRYLLGPLRLHRHSESRAVLPDDEHRRESGGPAVDGRVADVRPGHREPESARIRGAVSRRADHGRSAAVEQRLPAGHQSGHVHLEPRRRQRRPKGWTAPRARWTPMPRGRRPRRTKTARKEAEEGHHRAQLRSEETGQLRQ